MRVLILLALLAATGCIVERTPDTPSNAAIQLVSAIRANDEAAAELICAEISESETFDLDDPSTWRALTEFNQARRTAINEERTPVLGQSEYTHFDEVDLDVDQAWTEVEFRGETDTEIWRLNMVREDGKWRACSAEQRS